MGCNLLKNEKIIVFGANGLIGKAIVDLALSYGSSVVALDINLDLLNSNFQAHVQTGSLIAEEVDINCESAVWSVLNKNQDLTGAVNATYPRNSNYGLKLESVSLESFNENTNLILGSSYVFIKNCIKFFKMVQKPISIVNISSIYGVVAPDFKLYDETEMTMPVEYASSKAGIIHLTKYAVTYVNEPHFRMNCVSPGGIWNDQDKRFVESYRQKTVGSGLLEPKAIAETISFLLSPKSKNINGQNLIVDDGFTL